MAACCKKAIRTTSTTATKKPNEKVITNMIFCLKGRRIVVKSGIGSNRIAMSVIIFTGDEERYRVTMSVQFASAGRWERNTAPIGRHWKTLTNVNAKPAAFTTNRVT